MNNSRERSTGFVEVTNRTALDELIVPEVNPWYRDRTGERFEVYTDVMFEYPLVDPTTAGFEKVKYAAIPCLDAKIVRKKKKF